MGPRVCLPRLFDDPRQPVSARMSGSRAGPPSRLACIVTCSADSRSIRRARSPFAASEPAWPAASCGLADPRAPPTSNHWRARPAEHAIQFRDARREPASGGAVRSISRAAVPGWLRLPPSDDHAGERVRIGGARIWIAGITSRNPGISTQRDCTPPQDLHTKTSRVLGTGRGYHVRRMVGGGCVRIGRHRHEPQTRESLGRCSRIVAPAVGEPEPAPAVVRAHGGGAPGPDGHRVPDHRAVALDPRSDPAAAGVALGLRVDADWYGSA
jgi:hypothetical protein